MPYNTIRHGKSLVSVAIAVAMVASPLAIAASPTPAAAQTIKEIDASIAEVEATIREQEEVVSGAQAILSEAVKEAYKSGDLASGSEMELILNADTLDDLISNSQYVEAMNGKYASTIDSAREALAELAEARDALVELRAEKEAQIKSRERADSMHFCQWGEDYSDIRYYAGTIGSAGCGLCAYTVAMNILKGTDYTPETILPERGDWQGMDHYPDDCTGTPDGSTHAQWTKTAFDVEMEALDNSVSALREALSDNESVVTVMARGQVFKNKQGTWRYTGGHYVCIYRCDDKGFYVQDSSYKGDEGTAVYYTDDEITGMLNSGTLVWYHN